MSIFKVIREELLDVSQGELGLALECSQGNVSLLDKGQTLMPDMAKKLISFAKQKGVVLTMDQVYGVAPLPARPGEPLPEQCSSHQQPQSSS
jgi:putative transcriptional regulator